MKFWDSSALLPLLIEESTTAKMVVLLRTDRVACAWWGTRIECVSAISRLERTRAMSTHDAAEAISALGEFLDAAAEIPPSDAVRERACRLLRVHSLGAADAQQLAAALVLRGEEPISLEFVCLDNRLRDAAMREGFKLQPPTE